jgi:hypothetical protein
MTERDAKIIKDSEERNIPIFVFIAKDAIMSEVMQFYYERCVKANCNDAFLENLDNHVQEVYKWQKENADFVKDPD